MDKLPTIKTDRLILSKISHDDVTQIVQYAGNEKIAAATLNIPHPYEEKDAIFWINTANRGFQNGTQYTFGIRIKSSTEFIGGIGLKVNRKFNRAELGYWIAVPFWNKGYATEALKAILAFGFNTLDLHKIYATHLIENPASGKVMLKNGMVKEADLKEHIKKDGVYKSLLQYRLTRGEFEQLIPS